MKIGFDNDKYLKMQSEHIKERIAKFDNKLYLEFGGKLFDDYHASRVLPGFKPDSKLPVSYTHLDVYKRQLKTSMLFLGYSQCLTGRLNQLSLYFQQRLTIILYQFRKGIHLQLME